MLSDTTQSAFWDERINKYVAYVRARTNKDRSVARMESTDFINWTEPQVVLEGIPSKSLYSMGVTPYEGIYIGTPWIFESGAEKSDRPVIWPELAVSRDGIKWNRPFHDQPLVSCGPVGSPDSRQIRMSASLVVLDDKILMLYGQTDRGHANVDMRIDIGMATMRLDGFASLTAGKTKGTILTRQLQLPSGKLFVNADVKPDGFLKAELLDSSGHVLNEYDLASCEVISENKNRIPLAWKNKKIINATKGDAYQIRFVLKRAKLYSYWME